MSQTIAINQLIVVDQGNSSRLRNELGYYEAALDIVYVSMEERGASRGRNKGIDCLLGDDGVVFFPDDDGWYPDNFCRVALEAIERGASVVGGRSVAEDGGRVSKVGSFGEFEFDIDMANVLYSTIEAAMVVRSEVARKIRFDPLLGVGSGTPLGSDEGADFLVRAIRAGYRARFTPRLVLFHPDPLLRREKGLPMRGRAYAAGRGFVLRKYRFPLRVLTREFLGPVIRMTQYALHGDLLMFRYYSNVFGSKAKHFILGERVLSKS